MYKLPNGKMAYVQDVQCVHDPVNGKGGIFIGNLEAAQNLQTLKKNGIKAVLTAAKGVFLNHCKNQIPYQLYIPGQDHEKFDISKFFNQSITFIKDALQKTNILVHCLAGVSRSVSLVIAYFIKYHNMSYDSVYTKIKSRRKIIHPNDGFIVQLRRFESQCRENGPVLQRNDNYEVRSSYSPSKRINRRGYEGYEASPQKYYQSPSKRYNRNGNDYGHQQFQSNSRANQPQSQTVKNPQLYKSIAQDLRKQRQYRQSNIRRVSPDRYQQQNTTKSSLGLKRLSSMNVEIQRPADNVRNIDNMKRSDIFNNYQKYQTRGRISSDYKPLDSIQNKQYEMNTQIDRKIAQIRKKYQQYTKQPERPIERSRIQRKYSNISPINENNENSNIDDLMDLKIRKITSDFDHSRNDLYNGVGMTKQNNYLVNQSHNTSGTKYAGSRLRRLQSYQV